jgi:MFS family permease
MSNNLGIAVGPAIGGFVTAVSYSLAFWAAGAASLLYAVIIVFLVRETLHSSATWYGLVGATWGVGVAIGALAAGRWRAASVLARGLVVAAFVLPLGISGYAVAPTVGWLLPSAIVGGIANGVLNVTTAALLMRRVSPAELGRVGAVIGAVSSGSEIGAYLLAGGLGQVLTPREVIAVAGLASLIAPIVFARRVLQTATHDADSVGHSRDRLDRPRVHT